MGGRFGRNRNAAQNDPFYNAVPTSDPGLPPSAPFETNIGPYSELGEYGPHEQYGTAHEPEPPASMENYRGRRGPRAPNNYGGRYAQGLNQMAGVSPWNYGNYYLGNTTMQMMPFMLNKVNQYAWLQAMGALGGAGMGGSTPMMPWCMPSSYNMSMAAPMMAAATPLPVAFNPLVQGMYPMASMSPVNWMAPSSFMSALTMGPMPYRPPAYDFPSNVGMVMAIPYGTPNPLLSSPANPMPYSTPLAISHIPQMPVHQPASMSSLPVISANYQPLPVGVNGPLLPSQGVFNHGGIGQSTVMASQHHSSTGTWNNNPSAHVSNALLPIYNPANQSFSPIEQRLPSNISNLPFNNHLTSNTTSSTAKNNIGSSRTYNVFSGDFRPYLPSSSCHSGTYPPRSDPILPHILHGKLISDTGWLPKSSVGQSMSSAIAPNKIQQPMYTTDHSRSNVHSNGSRVTFYPHRPRHRRRRRRSNSSVSEYDCAICAQQREKRRLLSYLGSTRLASLLSPSKKVHNQRRRSSNESFSSSLSHASSSRRHHKQDEVKRQTPPSTKQSVPVIPRQSLIRKEPQRETILEAEEEEEEDEEEEESEENDTSDDDKELKSEKIDHH